MKRATMLFTVILSLVLIAYPSTPSRADSAASSASGGVNTVDDNVESSSGAGNGAGGENEGDADGLAGNRQRVPGLYGNGDGIGLVVRTWWKLMWWIR